MRILLFILFCSSFFFGSSQSNINCFEGNFEQALDDASARNKDVFLITRSETCPNYFTFRSTIEDDQETCEFLNSTFVIYEFDFDRASDDTKKRMKKYYHSWWGFPQLYFLDINENIIAGLVYPPNISQNIQLSIWRDYKNIYDNWKTIKRKKRRKKIDYKTLMDFIEYRQMINSSLDLLLITYVLDKYFKHVEPDEYFKIYNWNLHEKYISIYSNPKLFDFVAQNKTSFQEVNGDTIVSEYLFYNYFNSVKYQKEKKVRKMKGKYPYNEISEAKRAINMYYESMQIENLIIPADLD